MKTILAIAAIAAALTVRPATEAGAPADNAWKVDSTHSSVVFKVKHAGASWFYGTFSDISGSFTLDPAALGDAKIALEIDAQSIGTRDEKRDQHLRGPDFFDAKQFPKISFASTKVAKAGDGFLVTGNLTLRGETKPIEVQVAKTGEGEFYGKRVGYEATFAIKRSDFGMDYGIADKALGDEITLWIAVEGVQGEAK